MTFNSDLRDEKPKPKKKSTEAEKAPTERELDEALKGTFPASDPVAAQSQITGSRAKKPVPPKD